MVAHSTPFWIWLLPLVVSSPWIAGSVLLWRYRDPDASIPPSVAHFTRGHVWTN